MFILWEGRFCCDKETDLDDGGFIKSKKNVERHASASLCRVMDCSGCQLLFSEKGQPAEGHTCVKLLLKEP